MNKKILSIFLLVIGFLIPANLFSIDIHDKIMIYNTDSVSSKIGNIKVKMEEEYHFAEFSGTLLYQHTDLGFSYGFTKWLALGLNYRHIYELKSNERKEENRPHLNAVIKTKLSNINIEDKNRFEFRIKSGKYDSVRYRNKLTLKFDLNSNINPYLANEMFISMDGAGFNENRIYAGAKMKIINNLYGTLYYLFDMKKKSDLWKAYQIIGINVDIK